MQRDGKALSATLWGGECCTSRPVTRKMQRDHRNELNEMLLVVECSKEPDWEGQVRSLPLSERYALLSFLLSTAKAIGLVKVDVESIDLRGSQRVEAPSHAECGAPTSRTLGYHRL